jgi:UDP-N-acetylmuramyl pentapeptide phosphotransferase/UDP-N-acetylglucosamine-1-phosphate transferase
MVFSAVNILIPVDMPFSPLIAPFVAFIVTFALIWYLISSETLRILDYPNPRSLHSTPIPRSGGLGVISGILASWAFLPEALPSTVWIGVVVMVAISFADDVFGLPVWVRLLMHCAVALWFSAIVLTDAQGWMVVIIAAVVITWMLNLYNFMDGSDGLAGGMTLIGFGCYGVAAGLSGNEPFADVNFCVATAAAAFLVFNFYPARIFMGDAGSIPLGFLAAIFGMMGWKNGIWPLCFPLLVFFPFIADASVTLARRGLRGEKVWRAHREHYYQRMVQSGFGHRNTALIGYVLMLAAGATGIWATHQHINVQLGAVIAWSAIYLVMMRIFDKYWEHRSVL